MLQSKVSQAMAKFDRRTPYWLEDDPVIANYELIRDVWFDSCAIKRACLRHDVSRSQYYEKENRFVQCGIVGLFPEIKAVELGFSVCNHTNRREPARGASLRD